MAYVETSHCSQCIIVAEVALQLKLAACLCKPFCRDFIAAKKESNDLFRLFWQSGNTAAGRKEGDVG